LILVDSLKLNMIVKVVYFNHKQHYQSHAHTTNIFDKEYKSRIFHVLNFKLKY